MKKELKKTEHQDLKEFKTFIRAESKSILINNHLSMKKRFKKSFENTEEITLNIGGNIYITCF